MAQDHLINIPNSYLGRHVQGQHPLLARMSLCYLEMSSQDLQDGSVEHH